MRPQDESESEGPPLPPHGAPAPPPVMFASPRVGPVALSTLHRWTSTGNGALLLASLPLQWRAAGLNIQSLRALAISTWLSACGALLLMRELQLPMVRSWMRRHVRFATTPGGKRVMQLFGATLALTSGTASGFFIGVATVANHLFGRSVRQKIRAAKRAAPKVFPRLVAAPPEEGSDRDGYASPPPSTPPPPVQDTAPVPPPPSAEGRAEPPVDQPDGAEGPSDQEPLSPSSDSSDAEQDEHVDNSRPSDNDERIMTGHQ